MPIKQKTYDVCRVKNNGEILYFAAVETENKSYVKKYVRPIFYE